MWFCLVGGVQKVFFWSHSKGFYKHPNDCTNHIEWLFDDLRHVWDIFDPIEPLKIIFWDWIFETFRLNIGKNPFFGLLCLYKGFYYCSNLCFETKSLATCSPSIWQLYFHSSSSFERRWLWRLQTFNKV